MSFTREEISPFPRNPGKKNYVSTANEGILGHYRENEPGKGKKSCGCGYRIRGNKEDHENGPHHQGRRNGQ